MHNSILHTKTKPKSDKLSMKKLLLFIFTLLSLAFQNGLNKTDKKKLFFENEYLRNNYSATSNSFLFEFLDQYDLNDNLLTGNPSKAVNDFHQSFNFLMIKQSYALSYNNSKGCSNWVSWHLTTSWKGNAKRCNCFASDKELPNNFYKVSTKDYTKTGFDRGHLCPSEDRDLNDEFNAETFLMTNMIPQSPNLNRITWVALENYCRKLMDNGNELYIITGGYGTGGTGSKGYTEKIGNGHIYVPSHCWKIIVVLPLGNNDLQRITNNTRVIAVDIPNNQEVKSMPWYSYRTTINEIEEKTGYDFLNKVPDYIQRHLEGFTDNKNINDE